MAMTEELGEEEDPVAILRQLRRTRLRRRIGEIDRFEVLYNAYLTALVLGGVVVAVTGAVGGAELTGSDLRVAHQRGAEIIGVVAALLVALGVRSGSLGGPLALELPEVLHVMLSPIGRRYTLRDAVMRAIRFATFVGIVVGALAGVVAADRLPGGATGWVIVGAASGAAAGLMAVGAALITSGLQLGRRTGLLIGAVLISAELAAAAVGIPTPLSLLGWLALSPMEARPWGWAALPLALLIAAIGSRSTVGLSLEQAQRRSALVGEMRFAVTMQDLRTTIVLRRQLTQEHSRSRPWVRALWWAPSSMPVWRRAWRGLMRWPLVRPVRSVVLGAVSGLAAVGFWTGTDELIVVCGLLIWVAALEATESLAQEIDHPDRSALVPVATWWVHLRHLPAAAVVLLMPATVAMAVLAAFVDEPGLGGAALLSLVGLVITATGGAAISVVRGPPPPFNPKYLMVPPEAAGASIVARALGPPALTLLGVLPLIVLRLSKNSDINMAPTIPALLTLYAMVGAYAAWSIRRAAKVSFA